MNRLGNFIQMRRESNYLYYQVQTIYTELKHHNGSRSKNIQGKKVTSKSQYSDKKINTIHHNIPNYKNDEIIFYTPELPMCYYSDLTPCTNMTHEVNTNDIQLEIIYGYKKYSFIK